MGDQGSANTHSAAESRAVDERSGDKDRARRTTVLREAKDMCGETHLIGTTSKAVPNGRRRFESKIAPRLTHDDT